MLEWVDAFEASDAANALSPAARIALRGTVTVLERTFTDDVSDTLMSQLPRRVTAMDPAVVVDGAIAFLIWAVKTNRIRDRAVEYTCRKLHRDAIDAMSDPHRTSPATQIVAAAARDGIDPTNTPAIREHAISHGMSADFVDEFLPPGPMCLGEGRWIGLGE